MSNYREFLKLLKFSIESLNAFTAPTIGLWFSDKLVKFNTCFHAVANNLMRTVFLIKQLSSNIKIMPLKLISWLVEISQRFLLEVYTILDDLVLLFLDKRILILKTERWATLTSVKVRLFASSEDGIKGNFFKGFCLNYLL